jgi:hypothetical protein
LAVEFYLVSPRTRDALLRKSQANRGSRHPPKILEQKQYGTQILGVNEQFMGSREQAPTVRNFQTLNYLKEQPIGKQTIWSELSQLAALRQATRLGRFSACANIRAAVWDKPRSDYTVGISRFMERGPAHGWPGDYPCLPPPPAKAQLEAWKSRGSFGWARKRRTGRSALPSFG